MEDLYDRIDALIQEKGWSRRRLAERAGINPATLATLFKRRTKNPKFQYIQKIAKALNVSEKDILKEAGYYFYGIKDAVDWKEEPWHSLRLQEIEIDALRLRDCVSIYHYSKENPSERFAIYLNGAAKRLNSAGKVKVEEYISDLLSSPKYVDAAIHSPSEEELAAQVILGADIQDEMLEEDEEQVE